MRMFVGLGNPGRTYERTRHNVGFEVIDRLAAEAGASFRKSWRFPLESAEAGVAGEQVLLVKPQSFMNRSGTPLAALMRKKGLGPADLVVVVDDIDLPIGVLRLRKKGSAGGHNGLKSVIENLGTDEFVRVRVGVGRPEDKGDMVNHVLSKFRPEEQKIVDEAVGRAVEALTCMVREPIDRVMNKFNG